MSMGIYIIIILWYNTCEICGNFISDRLCFKYYKDKKSVRSLSKDERISV